MKPAQKPDDEGERLAALIALHILGTERTTEFNIFPGLASRLFAAPIAAISLVDSDRQWFKASVGLDATETPRDQSFCAHAILSPNKILYVPDATKDPRFADNPLVVGDLGLRFYAGAPIVGPSGHPLGALCVMDRKPRDVSNEALEQLRHLAVGVGSALRLHGSIQELRKLALTDPVTGLGNRAGFNVRLQEALTQRRLAPVLSVGLLSLNLDGFKAINDLFGHSAGDDALREVARRLRQVSRARDTLSRFGGDEFCILVEAVQDATDLNVLAARIHAALAEPFAVERQAVPLGTSIGIALCPLDAIDPDTLVHKADTALYVAKRAGRGITEFAVADTGFDLPSLAGRQGMQQMLRVALLSPGHEPFALVLQPIFQSQTGQLAAFEALVRWPNPDGRVMAPAEFIPVAEATGLVVQIDRWVLNQACSLAAGWPSHLQISSNLSAANFFAGDLVQDVQAALQRHSLAPDRLKLEITETVLLRDPSRVQATISALRSLGVRVVLDDFGAGHASLAYLRDYAFNGLKIDRSFTAELETNPQSQAFVRAIIEMARALAIEATVEGVETPGQLRMLRRSGIAFVQGYLLGKPMTPKAAADFIGKPAQPNGHFRDRSRLAKTAAGCAIAPALR